MSGSSEVMKRDILNPSTKMNVYEEFLLCAFHVNLKEYTYFAE